jgi:LPS-assembly lipoprotein
MIVKTGFRHSLLVLALIALTGCGFHLRGVGPSALSRNLYIEGIAQGDPFVADLGDALSIAGGKAVSAASEATGILRIYRAAHLRRSLSVSRFGRSTEFDLFFRVVFDVRTPKGEVVLPRQEIEIKRDYFNDQSVPLAQNAEEGVMRQEMQKEAAQAVLRRAAFALKSSAEARS